MTAGNWLKAERDGLASDRILDAAAELFLRDGVAATSMGEVARAAGCSRATVYRYFEDRPALQRAFMHREARRVAAEVAAEIVGIEDPVERVVEAIMRSVDKVRSEPALHAWFASNNVDVTRDLLSASDVIGSLVGGRDRNQADWAIRNVIGLLLLPGRSEDAERDMLRRFVAPALASHVGARPPFGRPQHRPNATT